MFVQLLEQRIVEEIKVRYEFNFSVPIRTDTTITNMEKSVLIIHDKGTSKYNVAVVTYMVPYMCTLNN